MMACQSRSCEELGARYWRLAFGSASPLDDSATPPEPEAGADQPFVGFLIESAPISRALHNTSYNGNYMTSSPSPDPQASVPQTDIFRLLRSVPHITGSRCPHLSCACSGCIGRGSPYGPLGAAYADHSSCFQPKAPGGEGKRETGNTPNPPARDHHLPFPQTARKRSGGTPMDTGGSPCRPRSAPRRRRSPTRTPPGPRRPRRQEGPERSTAPSGSLPQPCHPIPSSSHRALDVLLAFLLNQIPQANRLPIHRSP